MLYLQGFDVRGLDYGAPASAGCAPRSRSIRSAPIRCSPRRACSPRRPTRRRSRLALEFVYQEFTRDPDRRWPWLAHAALLAKHRLKDLPLARRYAAAIERQTRSRDVPLWARQMEIFILEDMNELEAARIMLGGLLERGEIRDPNELRFLQQRLKELDQRARNGSNSVRTSTPVSES